MGKKILIIEDNADHRRILVLQLRSIECEIIEASNCEDGIEKALAEVPDLILMDLGLPGIDGFETTIRLKQNPQTSHIPVIAYTALGRQFRDKAVAAGMAEFFIKTDPPEVLLELVRKYLRGLE
ncbi:MAG: response regulator [Deltaproteobacteria bacterium]|nr:response regulator [Deltaproteobacteria bacterium]